MKVNLFSLAKSAIGAVGGAVGGVGGLLTRRAASIGAAKFPEYIERAIAHERGAKVVAKEADAMHPLLSDILGILSLVAAISASLISYHIVAKANAEAGSEYVIGVLFGWGITIASGTAAVLIFAKIVSSFLATSLPPGNKLMRVEMALVSATLIILVIGQSITARLKNEVHTSDKNEAMVERKRLLKENIEHEERIARELRVDAQKMRDTAYNSSIKAAQRMYAEAEEHAAAASRMRGQLLEDVSRPKAVTDGRVLKSDGLALWVAVLSAGAMELIGWALSHGAGHLFKMSRQERIRRRDYLRNVPGAPTERPRQRVEDVLPSPTGRGSVWGWFRGLFRSGTAVPERNAERNAERLFRNGTGGLDTEPEVEFVRTPEGGLRRKGYPQSEDGRVIEVDFPRSGSGMGRGTERGTAVPERNSPRNGAEPFRNGPGTGAEQPECGTATLRTGTGTVVELEAREPAVEAFVVCPRCGGQAKLGADDAVSCRVCGYVSNPHAHNPHAGDAPELIAGAEALPPEGEVSTVSLRDAVFEAILIKGIPAKPAFVADYLRKAGFRSGNGELVAAFQKLKSEGFLSQAKKGAPYNLTDAAIQWQKINLK